MPAARLNRSVDSSERCVYFILNVYQVVEPAGVTASGRKHEDGADKEFEEGEEEEDEDEEEDFEEEEEEGLYKWKMKCGVFLFDV